MCGIAGIIGHNGTCTLDRTKSAIAILRHRGPDGSGIWQSRDGRVCLARARLGTLDLVSGNQPIANEDRTIIAVINGEFYDFEQTRTQLEALGHRFRTKTDSEVLVHLYEQYGVACLDRLQGEFAFLLWDDRQQLLWAARDRFGVKPLYYAEIAGEILFSSEVKGLQQAGLKLAWDEQGFLEQFVFQTCLSGRTLYRG
jgi:asparagine synthase (glutamine-hydrolysing)